jgi:hypothetical protein
VIITWLVVLVVASVYSLTGLAEVVSNDYESVVGLEKLSSSGTLSDTANASETIILRPLDGTTAGDRF